MRSFLERLAFQYLVYNKEHAMLFPKKMHSGLILTMNVPEAFMEQVGYGQLVKGTENLMGHRQGQKNIKIIGKIS